MRVIILLAFIGAAAAAVPTSRIVGGFETTVTDHGYMGNLQYYWFGIFPNHVCGAVIINNLYILSSCQCTYAFPITDFGVILGSDNIDGSGGISYTIESVTYHPDYDSNTLTNDISLIRVAQAIDITNPSTTPVAIAGSSYALAVGTAVRTLGWGSLQESGSSSQTLRAVDYNIVDQATCALQYQQLSNFPDVAAGMMCTAALDGDVDKGTCLGDIGGPTIHISSTAHICVGINSWGNGCGDRRWPDVNTMISSHSQWIIDTAV